MSELQLYLKECLSAGVFFPACFIYIFMHSWRVVHPESKGWAVFFCFFGMVLGVVYAIVGIYIVRNALIRGCAITIVSNILYSIDAIGLIKSVINALINNKINKS